MDVKVSIIIVNYNTAELLDNCIDSILTKTEDVEYEIIVIDNNSEEGSLLNLVKKYPIVRFIFSENNLGFGLANNLGVAESEGKYLLFLNPDTILLNNAILILYDFMESHQQAGVCGGNLYKPDHMPTVSFHTMSFYTREWRILFNKKRTLGFNHSDKPLSVKVIMGADLFIRKDLFNKIGGFDKDFFLYFEEVYLCDLVRKDGYSIFSVPQAEIIHIEGASAENKDEDLNKWSYKEHWYSKFIYFYKTEGRFKTMLIYCGQILKMKLATLIYTIKKSSAKLDYWKAKSDVITKAYLRYRQYLKE